MIQTVIIHTVVLLSERAILNLWEDVLYLQKYKREVYLKQVIIYFLRIMLPTKAIRSKVSAKLEKFGSKHLAPFICEVLYVNKLFAEILDNDSKKTEISVLDIGGGVGDNFAIPFGYRNRLSWHIVDNSSFVRTFDYNPYKNKVKYFINIDTCENINYDLIFIRGTLQYLEPEFINRLTKLGTKYILISRTVLSNESQIVNQKVEFKTNSFLVQNKIYTSKDIVKLFSAAGYAIHNESHSHFCNLISEKNVIKGHYKIFLFKLNEK